MDDVEGSKEVTDEDDMVENILHVFRHLQSNRRVLVVFDHIDEEQVRRNES